MAADAGSAIREFAPAKINLTLHVTGRRADGYHLLDSLVAFAGVGDEVIAEAGDGLSLRVEGPMAGALADDGGAGGGGDNLVLRAARLLDNRGRGARLTLVKRLPVASGIGGGSSDAAAAVRALARLWGGGVPGVAALAALGADVPVCMGARAARMRGIGEAVEATALPPVHAVLVNPGVAVPTAAVFTGLVSRDNPAMPEGLPRLPDFAALVAFLSLCRNDLEAPAMAAEPVIGDVLSALRAMPGCALARMSGSGATCFGLFGVAGAAESAARAIAVERPGWWVVATRIG
jgi:4-diphosphocytidyl-2-C-methyl-D-erythritol kinase